MVDDPGVNARTADGTVHALKRRVVTTSYGAWYYVVCGLKGQMHTMEGDDETLTRAVATREPVTCMACIASTEEKSLEVKGS